MLSPQKITKSESDRVGIAREGNRVGVGPRRKSRRHWPAKEIDTWEVTTAKTNYHCKKKRNLRKDQRKRLGNGRYAVCVGIGRRRKETTRGVAAALGLSLPQGRKPKSRYRRKILESDSDTGCVGVSRRRKYHMGH